MLKFNLLNHRMIIRRILWFE